MTSGNGRRHYTSLCKIKIMIARPTMRCNGWGINIFIFNFTTMFIQPRFQPSSCLTNIAKITRRTWNKIDATPVLNRNRIFRRGKFNFVNRSKRDFVFYLLNYLLLLEESLLLKLCLNYVIISQFYYTTLWIFSSHLMQFVYQLCIIFINAECSFFMWCTFLDSFLKKDQPTLRLKLGLGSLFREERF